MFRSARALACLRACNVHALFAGPVHPTAKGGCCYLSTGGSKLDGARAAAGGPHHANIDGSRLDANAVVFPGLSRRPCAIGVGAHPLVARSQDGTCNIGRGGRAGLQASARSSSRENARAPIIHCSEGAPGNFLPKKPSVPGTPRKRQRVRVPAVDVNGAKTAFQVPAGACSWHFVTQLLPLPSTLLS